MVMYFLTSTLPTAICTLSLHDALPISSQLLACLLALEPVPSEPPSEPRARRSERVSRALLPELQASPLARQERRAWRSEEHTSELQSQSNLVCRLLLEKSKTSRNRTNP